MSYVAPYQELDASSSLPQVHYDAAAAPLAFVPRWKLQWVPLALPVLLCFVSWMANGIPIVTDVGFALMTAICFVYLVGEFFYFPRRFGIGGIVLYGGVLVWFCHDYIHNWFFRNFDDTSLPYYGIHADVIAKAAFFHTLFVMCMAIGLRLPGGRFIQRCILAIPEPSSESFYIVITFLIALIGLSPFIFFVNESPALALYHAVTASWTQGVEFSVWRTGNLNTNWGGYVAQIIQVGEVGAIFAVLVAILVTRNWLIKVLCWCIWLFWTMFVFNGGRRGEFAFMALPPLGLYFVKFQARAAMRGKKHSILAYAMCGALAVGILAVVQFQGTFRGSGFADADLSDFSLTTSQGNTMFSEGLLAWKEIPDQQPFFKNSSAFEGLLRPLPEQAFWFVIGPIPRALWTNKPVDSLWEWYNREYTGVGNGTSGTTISHGLVGSWYFNYGIFGCIEGALLVGWLMGLSERALQHSDGRPLGILMSLSFAVWLFRIYRDFIFIDLYGLMIGGIALACLIYLCRPFMGSSQPTVSPLAHGAAPEYSAG